MTAPIQSILARKKAVAIGVVAAAVVGLGVANLGGNSQPDYRLRAMFTDASPLIVGNEVKLDGVKVGKVSKIKLVDGKAEVDMDLDKDALPLHTDARLLVRPVTLLGERYVEVQRGTASAPVLPEGRVLPVTQTGQSVGLDQVLNTLDDPTGTSLAALVTMLGEGADGNGANIAAAIKALGPAMRDTTRLAKILDDQNALLTSTLDSVGGVAAALADDHGRTLDTLVSSADQLLGTTSTNEAALRQLLAQLPQTLSTARATLAELAGTAHAAVPTLKSIRPVTDNLSAISTELDNFASATDPALASAGPVLEKARVLLDKARPVVAALEPAGPAVRSVAKSAQPLVRDVTPRLEDVMNFLKNWALVTNGFDGLSHYFRVEVALSPQTVTAAVPGLGTNLQNLGIGGTPPPPGQEPTNGILHDLHPKLPPLGGLINGVLGILSPKKTADGGVTGLTKTQEQGGLLSLLGLGGK